jgi:hypothetical protein
VLKTYTSNTRGTIQLFPGFLYFLSLMYIVHIHMYIYIFFLHQQPQQGDLHIIVVFDVSFSNRSEFQYKRVDL